MKHKIKTRSLGRTKANRQALYKNLTTSLINQGYAVTTPSKAKELKRYFEPLVTTAKQEMTLARRRQLISRLGQKQAIAKLIAVAQANKNRPGGYIRTTKIPPAVGNGAPLVKIALLP